MTAREQLQRRLKRRQSHESIVLILIIGGVFLINKCFEDWTAMGLSVFLFVLVTIYQRKTGSRFPLECPKCQRSLELYARGALPFSSAQVARCPSCDFDFDSE